MGGQRRTGRVMEEQSRRSQDQGDDLLFKTANAHTVLSKDLSLVRQGKGKGGFFPWTASA